MVLYSRSGKDIDRGLVGYWKLDDLKRIPTDGIVAHYKMNDDAANTIVVDSKLGNDATASANTSTLTSTGKINESLDLNATATVQLPDGVGDNFSNGISFSVWIFHDTIVTTNVFSEQQTVFSSRTNTTTAPSTMLSLRDSDYRFRYFDDGGVDVTTTTPQIALEWVHLVCVLDRPSGTMILYKNGVQVDSDTVAYVGTNFGSDSFLIGNSIDMSAFDGKVDDFRIYNRPLSLSEVQTINNSGAGTETTELFRQTVVAIDRANFNDGTINGATNTEGVNGLNPDAMFFDGVDDFVEIDEQYFQEKMTVEGWINWNSLENRYIFSTQLDSNNRFNFRVTSFDIISRGEVGGVEFGVTTSSNKINAGENHHIAVTKNGSDINIYIDGEKEIISPNVFGSTGIDGKTFIGTASSTTSFFNGKISLMRVHNRILTDGEISKLHRLKL